MIFEIFHFFLGSLLKIKGETSDEDSNFDNASIITGFSDNRSILEEEPDQPDEATQEELFEEKLKEALDGLSEKSSQRRLQCLESISNGFMKKIVPDFINDRLEFVKFIKIKFSACINFFLVIF